MQGYITISPVLFLLFLSVYFLVIKLNSRYTDLPSILLYILLILILSFSSSPDLDKPAFIFQPAAEHTNFGASCSKSSQLLCSWMFFRPRSRGRRVSEWERERETHLPFSCGSRVSFVAAAGGKQSVLAVVLQPVVLLLQYLLCSK